MKTIFELELISTRGARYPIRKTHNNLMLGTYTSLERAEKAMMSVVKSWVMDCDTFCYIITERKLNPKLGDEDEVAVRTYLPDGSWYEENLVGRDGVFRGRPADRIHFEIGDIVEIYCGDMVALAIIGNVPPSTEFAEKMRQRHLKAGMKAYEGYFMDKSDDQYMVYDTCSGGHRHIESQFVFPPRKSVSKALIERLKEQMAKGG